MLLLQTYREKEQLGSRPPDGTIPTTVMTECHARLRDLLSGIDLVRLIAVLCTFIELREVIAVRQYDAVLPRRVLEERPRAVRVTGS